MAKNQKQSHLKRQRRVRNKLKSVSTGRLRLSVFRSSKNIYAQIVDDAVGNTLVSASTLDADSKHKGKCTVQGAEYVGKMIAEKAKKAGVDSVYFDRGGYPYHGRIKAVAEAVRSSGITV